MLIISESVDCLDSIRLGLSGRAPQIYIISCPEGLQQEVIYTHNLIGGVKNLQITTIDTEMHLARLGILIFLDLALSDKCEFQYADNYTANKHRYHN